MKTSAPRFDQGLNDKTLGKDWAYCTGNLIFTTLTEKLLS